MGGFWSLGYLDIYLRIVWRVVGNKCETLELIFSCIPKVTSLNSAVKKDSALNDSFTTNHHYPITTSLNTEATHKVPPTIPTLPSPLPQTTPFIQSLTNEASIDTPNSTLLYTHLTNVTFPASIDEILD